MGVVLQYVEHHFELREDQHLALLLAKLWQQLVEELHFAACRNQQVELRRVGGAGRAQAWRRQRRLFHALCIVLLHAVTQERVVADLPQLHGHVPQEGRVFRGGAAQQSTNLVGKDGLVVGALLLRELHPNNALLLLRECLHIFFHASEQQRLELLLQGDNLLGSHLVSRPAITVQKLVLIAKGFVIQQIENTEQLFDIVLDGRARQQQDPLAWDPGNGGPCRALGPLHPVGLVDDHGLPVDGLKQFGVLHDVLKGGQHNIGLDDPRPRAIQLILVDDCFVRGSAAVQHTVHVCPRLKLPLPVTQRGQRGDDQKRVLDLAKLALELEAGDRLRRLAKAHLVAENAVLPVVPVLCHPFQRLLLIIPELPPVAKLWQGAHVHGRHVSHGFSLRFLGLNRRTIIELRDRSEIRVGNHAIGGLPRAL